MTVIELNNQLKELIKDGKGDAPVYFKDGHAHFPIREIKGGQLVEIKAIILRY